MPHADPQTFDRLRSSQAVSGAAIVHLDRCVTCRRAAAAGGVSDAHITAALGRARAKTRSLVLTCAAVAAVAFISVSVPLRGAAYAAFGVFEPRTVRAVPVTLDELRSLSQVDGLAHYATSRVVRTATSATFADARSAATAAGFPLRQPVLAADGIRAATYFVTGPSSQVLTFDAHRTGGSGTLYAPLPADIAGTTLRIDLGATTVATYATAASAAEAQRLAAVMRRLARAPRPSTLAIPRSGGFRSNAALAPGAPGAPGAHVVATVRSLDGARHATSAPAFVFSTRGAGLAGTLPLVVVQMPVPRIASTGVSVDRLASFMLTQPGVPPRVAAAFGALGDLSTTLPIPVPIDKAYTQPVFVDGVEGVGLGDDTGIGAAVVWQQNGMLYAVFATRTAREVLAIANSLR